MLALRQLCAYMKLSDNENKLKLWLHRPGILKNLHKDQVTKHRFALDFIERAPYIPAPLGAECGRVCGTTNITR
jgi:hypothetical protein